MSEITVQSWSDLQHRLFEEAWIPEIGRYRSQFAYRGHSDAAHPLISSLMRLGGDYHNLEHHLLRNFRKYAARASVERDSFWNWLALAQHHGLPTRLMDWTFSPYVALHFTTACEECFDRDGAVWAVNFVEVHKLLPARLKKKSGVRRLGCVYRRNFSRYGPDARSA